VVSLDIVEEFEVESRVYFWFDYLDMVVKDIEKLYKRFDRESLLYAAATAEILYNPRLKLI
jgi:hypothetical protein